MKIATWNVERLKHRRNLPDIVLACESARADILVLTETDTRVRPNYKYCFQTPLLTEVRPDYYGPTENRVTILTDYECIRQYETYDRYTALCVELETERGSLLVYGTIMGIYGNRHPSFRADLPGQCEDILRLTQSGKALCVCGDYNLSFADNYYFTTFGRDLVLQTFSRSRMRLLTADVPECIDHIAVSNQFAGEGGVRAEEWNDSKTLSDHKGIAVTF